VYGRSLSALTFGGKLEDCTWKTGYDIVIGEVLRRGQSCLQRNRKVGWRASLFGDVDAKGG
jgi:hypothetical protein